MKKKLIFVTEALWIGGIETALVNLLNAIDYDKYSVTVLIIRGELDLKDRINPNCNLIIADRNRKYSFNKKYKFARLYHFTEECNNPSNIHKVFMWTIPIIKYVENELYIKYIKEQMMNTDYDTAIIYSDRTAEIVCRAIKAEKYLMFYHNGIMDKAYHDEIGYKKSEKVIAVSEDKAELLRKFRAKYSDKIICIHNIVGIEDIIQNSQKKMDIEFRESDYNIVTCGRLVYPKAIDWAIEACKLLVERGYKNIKWWVVGGGMDEEKLRLQIKEQFLENNFCLLGMKKNPYPYIANADLYVQPSRYENYSVVILEAMVLEKTILATKSAGSQQIKDGINGKICEDNPYSIAENIEMLINKPRECRRYMCYLKEHTLKSENDTSINKLEKLF
ncbi:MAG: glycosyltransferase [Lachnospiraceae bacterium]|nr:glycosyltransferase [Lachnospiraceae bacterium]